MYQGFAPKYLNIQAFQNGIWKGQFFEKKKKKVKLESKTVDLNDLLIHTTHFFSLFFKQIN